MSIFRRNGMFDVYKNKKILVTGHTGFKGSWLSLWLHEIGAEVIGCALNPYTADDIYVRCDLQNKISDNRLDIRNYSDLKDLVHQHQPDFIFHLAAQTIVADSYDDPLATIETNIMGTTNILEIIRNFSSIQGAVIVTTDKVYRNNNEKTSFIESDPLGGSDPYSASKASCEILVDSYRKSFFKDNKFVATVRPGNTIGGGDWRKYRLIPDTVRALHHNKEIFLRKPKATRPWIFILDAVNAYLVLGKFLIEGDDSKAKSWNVGPTDDKDVSVERLVSSVIKAWNNGSYRVKSPRFDSFYEETFLYISSRQFQQEIDWICKCTFDDMVNMTVSWYKEALKEPKKTMYDFSTNQIKEFLNV